MEYGHALPKTTLDRLDDLLQHLPDLPGVPVRQRLRQFIADLRDLVLKHRSAGEQKVSDERAVELRRAEFRALNLRALEGLLEVGEHEVAEEIDDIIYGIDLMNSKVE